MLHRDVKPTVFDLKRLEREVDALARVDAATAFEVRSSIAALCWDVDGVRREVRNLLHLDSSTRALLNSAVTFNWINEVESALEHARRAWLIAPKNEEVAADYFSMIVRNGRIREASRSLAELGMPASMTDRARSTERIAQTMDDLGLTDERVHAELLAAFDIMKDRRIRAVDTDFGTQRDPESGAISLIAIMTFHGDFDDEAEIVNDLAAVMMDNPSWDPTEFAILFSPLVAKSDVLHAA